MSPFEKLTGKSPGSTTTKALPPVRQYRPINTGNAVIDNAHRQIYDIADNLRNNYGPSSLFAVGAGDDVAVPATDTDDGNAFSVSTTFTRQGTWVVTCAVALNIIGDTNIIFRLALQVDRKTITSHYGYANLPGDGQTMLHQSWQVPAPLGTETCTLLIRKEAAGAGTSTVTPISSTITATWQGA